jgi:hypothetical protein
MTAEWKGRTIHASTPQAMSDHELADAIASKRRILTYATGEYRWDVQTDLDDLVAEQLRRVPEGEARAMEGNR